MAATYALVSLPLQGFASSDESEALSSLRATASDATLVPYPVPAFRIGTLDALVQHADDLAKLDSACRAMVQKSADSLRSLFPDNAEKVSQQQTVNDKPTDQYLRNFSWNKVRYRAERPIGELIDVLQKELATIDNDVKAKFNQYNTVKSNLANLQRKQNGNLATKSLTPVVNPKILVQDSEYLETHLIAVPNTLKKDFFRTYESLSPMVVPRSACEVAQDDEFVLFAVTTFKKHSADFQHKCRENKWTPRQYTHVQGGKEQEQKEIQKVSEDERKVWGEALRLGRTGWSESVMIWAHVMALRVFVESVLRYGLPAEFVSAMVLTNSKLVKKVKTALDSAYAYLGGNAFGRDKKGRITKDDAALSSDMAAAGLGGGDGHEYTGYVYYEFELP